MSCENADLRPPFAPSAQPPSSTELSLASNKPATSPGSSSPVIIAQEDLSRSTSALKVEGGVVEAAKGQARFSSFAFIVAT